MVDVNTVILENGIEYTEVDDLTYNNIRYVLLANVKNVKDSCIRKISVKEEKEYLSCLDNDQEFDFVLDLFMQQNKTLFS